MTPSNPTPEPETESEKGPKCAHCGKPATCLGRYEDGALPDEYSCDDCCGHGNEDGHCTPVQLVTPHPPADDWREMGPQEVPDAEVQWSEDGEEWYSWKGDSGMPVSFFRPTRFRTKRPIPAPSPQPRQDAAEVTDGEMLDWLEKHTQWHDPENRVKIFFPMETVSFTTLRAAITAAIKNENKTI